MEGNRIKNKMNTRGVYTTVLIVTMIIRIHFSEAEIVNNYNVTNIAIPRGNYTQIRLSAFGFGDESLEEDIS